MSGRPIKRTLRHWREFGSCVRAGPHCINSRSNQRSKPTPMRRRPDYGDATRVAFRADAPFAK